MATASPTDAFRLVTLAPLDPAMVETGLGGVAGSLGRSGALATVSLLIWPVLALAAAEALFRRAEP